MFEKLFGSKPTTATSTPSISVRPKIVILGKDAATIKIVSKEELLNIDIALIIDISGSMKERSLRFTGKTRYQEVESTVMKAAEFASEFDDDGITVIFFSDDAETIDGITPDKVATLFKSKRPDGRTDLVAALKNAADKARSSKKDFVGLVFTDGEPNSQDASFNTLNSIGREFGRPRIGFTFIQVGENDSATKFLRRLNNELDVDVCAAVSASEAEELSLGQLIELARTA